MKNGKPSEWCVFKDLYVDGRLAVQQERPDICASKKEASAAFADAFAHLLGRKPSAGQAARFSKGGCVRARSGHHIEYRFTLIRK